MLYKFTARDENDLSVERGELLTVLNKDDPDWFWVVKTTADSESHDQEEGFVPSAFVFPLNFDKNAVAKESNTGCHDNHNHGVEMVMLYDYKVLLKRYLMRMVCPSVCLSVRIS